MSILFNPDNYIDQSIQDLHYNVFSGYPEENAFDIIKQGIYSTKFAKVTAFIIGESHCLNIDIGSESVTEVLAGVIPKNESMILKASAENIFEQDFSFKRGSLSYTFQADKIHLGTGDENLVSFENFYQNASINSFAIEHIFQMPTEYVHEAKTAIAVSQENEELSIQTLHLYPNEGTGVVTTTVVRAMV